MPELNITRGYEDGEALLEADLDNIKTAVTTLNNTTKYDGDNIQSSAITAAKIINGTVTSDILGAGSITTNKIDDLDVTTAKIIDEAIETRVIADSAVTTAKLANSSVTTAKFDTTARLSSSKIAARVVLTGSNASPTADSTGSGEVTIATATAVADMRRCLIILQPYDSTAAYVEVLKDYGTIGTVDADIRFKINGVTQATRTMSISNSDVYRHYYRLPISAFSMMMSASSPSAISIGDTITATLSLQLSGTATGSATVTACKLYVIEL